MSYLRASLLKGSAAKPARPRRRRIGSSCFKGGQGPRRAKPVLFSRLWNTLTMASLFVAAPALGALPSFQQIGNTLVMSNVNVRVEYNLATGRSDFYWQNAKKIAGFYAGVGLA